MGYDEFYGELSGWQQMFFYGQLVYSEIYLVIILFQSITNYHKLPLGTQPVENKMIFLNLNEIE